MKIKIPKGSIYVFAKRNKDKSISLQTRGSNKHILAFVLAEIKFLAEEYEISPLELLNNLQDYFLQTEKEQPPRAGTLNG